jgi:hypothetical protein
MSNKIPKYYTFHKLCLLYIIFENLSDFGKLGSEIGESCQGFCPKFGDRPTI